MATGAQGGTGRGRRILLLVAALTLAVPAAPLHAQPQVDTSRRDALEREINEYERLLEERRQEEARVQQQLGETRQRLDAQIAERDRVSAQLAQLRAQREELQAQMRAIEAEMQETEERIEGILDDLELLKVRIQALLVNLHRQRTGRFARVLSTAETFHELQVKNRYLALLNQQDTEVVRRLDTNRAQLESAQAQLSQQLAQREAAEADLQANQAQLEGAQAQLASIIAELESTEAGQVAQRQALVAAQEDIERTLGNLDRQLGEEIERLRQEEARLLREAQEAYLAERERQRLLDQAADVGQRIENLTAPLPEPSGAYIYPVAGASVVTRYGEDNNSYMAIRAESANAAVVAVGDGVVRGVSFISANDGYMVSVAHSDRISSVYTNLRPPSVQVGERVSQGQVIGYLGGSTLVSPDTLKLWVQVSEGGRSSFVDPVATLGY